MKTLQHGRLQIKYYDDVQEMPVVALQRFMKQWLVDAGIGSTMSDVHHHFAKLFQFMQASMVAEAAKELENLYYTLFTISEHINTKTLTLAALVHSIQGEEVMDWSDDGMKQVHDKLATLPAQVVQDIVVEVKKKLTDNSL